MNYEFGFQERAPDILEPEGAFDFDFDVEAIRNSDGQEEYRPGYYPAMERMGIARPYIPLFRQERQGKCEKILAYLRELEDAQGHQAAWDALRQICKRDLYFFAKIVLNFPDLDDDLHDDLCQFIVDAHEAKESTCTLLPRGHFKSTIATTARIIWLIIQNPNVTIGLFSSTMKNARKFMREVRNQLEHNEMLKGLFPEVFFADPRRQAPKWTEYEFIVKRTNPRREPTVKIFGLESGLPTGDHFDVMIGDDPIDQDTAKTPERMQKIAEQLKYLPPLLVHPRNPIHWIGTRYHPMDIFPALFGKTTIRTYWRPATDTGEIDGNPIFPKRFTKEDLQEIFNDLGSYVFECQYMLRPGDPKDKKLPAKFLKRFNNITPGEYGYAFFLVVDPANARRKKSDFTAMTLWAVDHEWNLFLLDGVHDKMDPYERIEAVFELFRRWKFTHVTYETIAFQDTDKFWLEVKQQERAIYFPVNPIPSHVERKDDRIMRIQPLLKAGRIHLPEKGIPYTRQWENPDDGQGRVVDLAKIFEQQLDYFPHLDHDDMLDTCAMACEVIRKPGFQRPPDRRAMRSGYDRRRRGSKGYSVTAH